MKTDPLGTLKTMKSAEELRVEIDDLARELDEREFATNPAPRLPVCLCLDVSSSMSGEKIRELNRGVGLFLEAVAGEPRAVDSVEVAVVTFEGEAELVADFQPVTRLSIPELTTGRGTSMGAGVSMALQQLAVRKDRYKSAGIEYWQPWLVLMTDGYPTDDTTEAARHAAQQVREHKLTVMPIGIGPDADLRGLKPFSPIYDPLRLKGLAFDQFFQWLSASTITVVSKSKPGDDVDVDVEGIKSWGTFHT